MPRMRHPNVEQAYEASDEQASMLAMSGWLTRQEWERAGRTDFDPPEPEPDDDDDEQDETPDESGEQKTKRPRRSRPRATSEKESD